MPPPNSIEVSSPLPAGHPTKGTHARSIDPCPPPPGARRRATRRAHLGRQSCGLADGHLQVRRRLRPCSLVSDSQHRSGGRGQLSSGGIDPAGHPIPSSHPPTRGAGDRPVGSCPHPRIVRSAKQRPDRMQMQHPIGRSDKPEQPCMPTLGRWDAQR